MPEARKVAAVNGAAVGPEVAGKAARPEPDAVVTWVEKGKRLSYAACGLPDHIMGVGGEPIA